MPLVPVDGNPFAQKPEGFEVTARPFSEREKLTPVDGNPFEAAPAGLTPAEGNPFGAPETARRATFGEAFQRATAGAIGSVGGTLEAVGEATGTESLTQYGRGIRQEQGAAAQQFPAGQEFLKIQSAADAAQWAKETAAELIPQMGPSLAGGAAGAALGATVGPVGAVAGGVVGAAVPSLLLNVGEVQSKIKAIDPKAEAPGTALGAGAAVAALDVITPFRLGSKLVGKFGIEAAEQIAERTLAKQVAVEAGKSASTEAVTEALQEAIGEVAASGALDKPVDVSALGTQMIESAAKGAFGGGIVGGGVAAVAPTRALAVPPTEEVVKDVFDKTVKEAASEFPVGDTEVRESAAAPAPIFYSQVRKIAIEKLPSVATAEQVLATLRNAPGVKEEELQATGIADWISKQQGKVAKNDVVAELEARAIDVQEVVHQESPLPQLTFEEAPIDSYAFRSRADAISATSIWQSPQAPGWTIVQHTDVSANGIPQNTFDLYNPQQRFVREADTLEAAQGALALVLQGSNTTQYKNWTLPGGENYREILLTLPQAGTRNLGGVLATEGPFAGAESAPNEVGIYQSPHFDEANIFAHTRVTDRKDSEGRRVLFVEEVQSDWHQEGRKKGYQKGIGPQFVYTPRGNTGYFEVSTVAGISYGDVYGPTIEDARVNARTIPLIPDAPFKTNWPELVVKRLLRLAADEGYERIAWATGGMQTERYGLGEAADAGQTEFYDNILPRLFGKWAKKLGGQQGPITFVDGNGRTRAVGSIAVPSEAATKIQEGLPLFSQLGPEGSVTIDSSELNGQPEAAFRSADGKVDLRPSARQAVKALGELAKAMGIAEPIQVRFTLRAHLGTYETVRVGGEIKGHVISLALARHANPEALFATIAHEFGHLVKTVKFDQAGPATQLGVLAAYEKWRAEQRIDESFMEFINQRDNFLSAYFNVRRTTAHARLASFPPRQRQYWLSFDEWFSEQVAKWVTTSEKPLNFVDRFFSALAKNIRAIYEKFIERFKLAGTPETFVRDWLDSLVEEPQVGTFDTIARMEEKTKAENVAAMKKAGAPDFPATPRTAATTFPRRLLDQLGLAELGADAAAGADRFNRFYNLMLSMLQVSDRNPHIRPLARYRELWQIKQLERARIMDEALATLKSWWALGREQSDKVVALLDDYMNMEFLSKDEIVKKIVRRPTEEEFLRLVRKHGVSADGLALFQRIVEDFDRMLTRYHEILVAEAQKIVDPTQQAEAIQAANETIERLRQQPYFPAMRFGDFTLTIRNAAGQVVHFETFESVRKRTAAEKALKGRLAPGERIHVGKLAKDARPLVGMPSGLLEKMAEKLDLSQAQREALQQLRFEMAPAQSFRHRFQRKERTPGYSKDFMRAYANYFFHGSNYFTNIKFVDALRAQVGIVRDSAKEMTDGTKRGGIANFLSEHLSYEMDPKSDWAGLRSFMFVWALGFSPAAAALNLTQLAVGSFPFLASKFNDVVAAKAMAKAGASVSTYYRKATLADATERDLRAISEGVKQGVITEALAPELAAISEGRNLGNSFGGNTATQAYQGFMEKAAWMFSMTEQMNRRITFRAAWQLASEQPTRPYVREAVQKHNLEYQRLRDSGWTETDAAAFVAAKDTVESTQFVYQRYAQPKFMRGRLRAVFLFKSFIQNTLFMLWNYPAAGVRSILIMGFLGGFMGIPGAEDLRSLLKAVAWMFFGKDFDLEKEARQFVKDILTEEIPPDILLHGAARRGMGIPAILSGLGVEAPVFDRSRSVGIGMVSPVDVGALFGPDAARDSGRVLAQETQRASGAAFGPFFNIYKAMTDGQLDWKDFKRWERAMPRAFGNVSRAYRLGNEGMERTRTGNAVVRYDVNDPRQMAEVIGIALGYQPLRNSAKWDLIMAEREAIMYWDIRRQTLLNQLWTARRTGEKEQYNDVLKAIRKFNADLPKEVRPKAITAETIQRSFKTRQTNMQKAEQGIPRAKQNIPLVQSIQRLYPEAEVDVRRTK